MDVNVKTPRFVTESLPSIAAFPYPPIYSSNIELKQIT